MIIDNVDRILDNGEFVTILLATGTAVHFPEGQHSISVLRYADGPVSVKVDLFDADMDK